jgi:GntR family transcriptional regulator, transcriptional repressor for pyruvate dehydrogenase complex
MDTRPHEPRIESRKRADQVRDRLIELIRSGRYQVGDQLPTETQLMATFGVGRSSVRAAVQSLVGLGIVELRPGRGTYVRRLSVDDLVNIVHGAFRLDFGSALHLHEVRAMIETASARLAAKRRVDDDLERMRQCVQDYAVAHAAGAFEQAIEADLAFHRAMIAAAGNPVLLSVLDSIAGVLKEHRREYGAPEDARARTRVIIEHDAILEAVEAGDARLAERRVAHHMRMIWDQIENVSSRTGDDSQYSHPEWFFDSLLEER